MDREGERKLLFDLRQLQLQMYCPQADAQPNSQSQESAALLLLTGSTEHWEAVCQQLQQLPPRTLFLSRGAWCLQQKHPVPGHHSILNNSGEEWLDFTEILSRFPLLEVGVLTRTTLVKVALGISDSIASTLILRYWREGSGMRVWYPELPKGRESLTPGQRVRVNQDREYLRVWKQMGAEFLSLAALLPLTTQVTSESKPGRQRRLWTFDDVKELPRGQVLRLDSNALITPLANDELRARQIEVVREVESHANR